MTITPRVPRITFPGPLGAVLNPVLDQWAQMIERSLRIQGDSPLTVTHGPLGVKIRLDKIPTIVPATASGSIANGTFASPTQGTANLYQMSGTAPVNLSITAKCWNIHDKTIATGAGMILGYDGANYWVLSVDSCTHLS